MGVQDQVLEHLARRLVEAPRAHQRRARDVLGAVDDAQDAGRHGAFALGLLQVYRAQRGDVGPAVEDGAQRLVVVGDADDVGKLAGVVQVDPDVGQFAPGHHEAARRMAAADGEPLGLHVFEGMDGDSDRVTKTDR